MSAPSDHIPTARYPCADDACSLTNPDYHYSSEFLWWIDDGFYCAECLFSKEDKIGADNLPEGWGTLSLEDVLDNE